MSPIDPVLVLIVIAEMSVVIVLMWKANTSLFTQRGEWQKAYYEACRERDDAHKQLQALHAAARKALATCDLKPEEDDDE